MFEGFQSSSAVRANHSVIQLLGAGCGGGGRCDMSLCTCGQLSSSDSEGLLPGCGREYIQKRDARTDMSFHGAQKLSKNDRSTATSFCSAQKHHSDRNSETSSRDERKQLKSNRSTATSFQDARKQSKLPRSSDSFRKARSGMSRDGSALGDTSSEASAGGFLYDGGGASRQREVEIRSENLERASVRPRRSDLSVTSIVRWNVGKVFDRDPQIDFKRALELCQRKLEVEPYTGRYRMPLSIATAPSLDRDVCCALLAWQAKGESDLGKLVWFANRIKEGNKYVSRTPSEVRVLAGGAFGMTTQAFCSDAGHTKPTGMKNPPPVEARPSVPVSPVRCPSRTAVTAVSSANREFYESLVGPVIMMPKGGLRSGAVPRAAAPRAAEVLRSQFAAEAAASKTVASVKSIPKCLRGRCMERLNALEVGIASLSKRATRIAEREAERIKMLQKAEEAWTNMERGYVERLQRLSETEDEIAERMKTAVILRNEYKSKCTSAIEVDEQVRARDVAARARLEEATAAASAASKALDDLAVVLVQRGTELHAEQARSARMLRDVLAAEDQTRRRTTLLTDELAAQRTQTRDVHHTLQADLAALREQYNAVARELMRLDELKKLNRNKIDRLKAKRAEMIAEMCKCKNNCNTSFSTVRNARLDKEGILENMRKVVITCKCKDPVDSTCQVKRTPSVAAMCYCTADQAGNENCSCAPLPIRMMASLLRDLFTGLQKEMIEGSYEMSCPLLQCLSDSHNWGKSSVVKTQLIEYFTEFVTDELDIAIATAIERSHVKWVGKTCMDSPEPSEYVLPLQDGGARRRNGGSGGGSGGAAGGSSSAHDANCSAARIYRRTQADVYQLTVQMHHLKKEYITRKDLIRMQNNLAKIVSNAAKYNSTNIIPAELMENGNNDNIKVTNEQTPVRRQSKDHEMVSSGEIDIYPIIKIKNSIPVTKFVPPDIKEKYTNLLQKNQGYDLSVTTFNEGLYPESPETFSENSLWLNSTSLDGEIISKPNIVLINRVSTMVDGNKQDKITDNIGKQHQENTKKKCSCATDCLCFNKKPSNIDIDELVNEMLQNRKQYLQNAPGCSEYNRINELDSNIMGSQRGPKRDIYEELIRDCLKSSSNDKLLFEKTVELETQPNAFKFDRSDSVKIVNVMHTPKSGLGCCSSTKVMNENSKRNGRDSFSCNDGSNKINNRRNDSEFRSEDGKCHCEKKPESEPLTAIVGKYIKSMTSLLFDGNKKCKCQGCIEKKGKKSSNNSQTSLKKKRSKKSLAIKSISNFEINKNKDFHKYCTSDGKTSKTKSPTRKELMEKYTIKKSSKKDKKSRGKSNYIKKSSSQKLRSPAEGSFSKCMKVQTDANRDPSKIMTNKCICTNEKRDPRNIADMFNEYSKSTGLCSCGEKLKRTSAIMQEDTSAQKKRDSKLMNDLYRGGLAYGRQAIKYTQCEEYMTSKETMIDANCIANQDNLQGKNLENLDKDEMAEYSKRVNESYNDDNHETMSACALSMLTKSKNCLLGVFKSITNIVTGNSNSLSKDEQEQLKNKSLRTTTENSTLAQSGTTWAQPEAEGARPRASTSDSMETPAAAGQAATSIATVAQTGATRTQPGAEAARTRASTSDPIETSAAAGQAATTIATVAQTRATRAQPGGTIAQPRASTSDPINISAALGQVSEKDRRVSSIPSDQAAVAAAVALVNASDGQLSVLSTGTYSPLPSDDECVCCPSKGKYNKNIEELQMNAFMLLQKYVQGKMKKMLCACCPHSKAAYDEETTFANMLDKIQNAISSDMQRLECHCRDQHELEFNESMTFTLLEEYIKSKINDVICTCEYPEDAEDTDFCATTLANIKDVIDTDLAELSCRCKTTEKDCTCIEDTESIPKMSLSSKISTNKNVFDKELCNCSNLEKISRDSPQLLSNQQSTVTISRDSDNANTFNINLTIKTNKSDKGLNKNCGRNDKIKRDASATKLTEQDVKTSPSSKTSGQLENMCGRVSHDIERENSSVKFKQPSPKESILENNIVDTNQDASNHNLPLIFDASVCGCSKNIDVHPCASRKKEQESKKGRHHSSFFAQYVSTKTFVDSKQYINHSLLPYTKNDNTYNNKESVYIKKSANNFQEISLSNNAVTKRKIFSSPVQCDEDNLKNNKTYFVDDIITKHNDLPDTSQESISYDQSFNKFGSLLETEKLESDNGPNEIPCECMTVPLCQVKLLVDDIKERLLSDSCICETMSHTVCPIHGKNGCCQSQNNDCRMCRICGDVVEDINKAACSICKRTSSDLHNTPGGSKICNLCNCVVKLH